VKTSLRWILLGLTVLPLLALAALLLQATRTTIMAEGEMRVAEYERTLMAHKRQELRALSELAYQSAQKYYDYSAPAHIGYSLKQRGLEFKATLTRFYRTQQATLPADTVRQTIVDFVRAYRFDDGVGYFWINDFGPKMICHPILSKLDGTDLSTYADTAGTKLFNDMVEVCKNDGDGFVTYRWLNPKSNLEEEKLSYVFTFEPCGWIVGTGEYLSVLRQNLQQKALEAIEKLRYGENGYFWINDFTPRMIMHALDATLNGRDLRDFTDSRGNKLFVDAAGVCRNHGEGFIRYFWPKPGGASEIEKLSYVRSFKQWQWIIGTGVYLDDVKAAVAAEERCVAMQSELVLRRFGMVAVPLALLVTVAAMMLVTRLVSLPLQRVISTVHDIGNDLTVRIEGAYRFEFDTLVRCFNGLLESLRGVIAQVAESVGGVDGSVREISGAVEGQAAQLSQQSAAITQITATVEQMSASSGQIAENASTVLGAAKDALDLSQKGEKAVAGIAATMERIHRECAARQQDIAALGQRSREISEVMVLINDIAEQTKLIAFNAALEASSAGEAGRRFGVVAAEIRNLADTVMEETREIESKVAEIQRAVDGLVVADRESAGSVQDGLVSSRQTTELLRKLVVGAEKTTMAARQISLSTQQQKTASSQIVGAMREINDGAVATAENIATINATTADLRGLSARLEELVSSFKI